MSSERTKMETAILALVIIAILISAGTLFYVMSIVGQLTPLAAIPEGLAELTAAERDLAKALADLGVDIAAIEERYLRSSLSTSATTSTKESGMGYDRGILLRLGGGHIQRLYGENGHRS